MRAPPLKNPFVIAYDIHSNKKRLKVSEMLEKYGNRANKSVFECLLTPTEERKLKEYVFKMINSKTDSVLFYKLCKYCYSAEWKTGVQQNEESITIV